MLKHPYLWFQSVFNSSACNCLEAMCVLSGKHMKLHDMHFVYWFILYKTRTKVLAARHLYFLKCSLLQRAVFPFYIQHPIVFN